MAKIEMDISEYKEMEKNAKLLEESLQRERKQQKKYNKLKEQQVKDLENNSKVVTIINETRTEEDLLNHRHPMEVFHSLEQYFTRKGRHFYADERIFDEIQFIQNTFFERVQRTLPANRIVTRKGLDEVYAEIKEEYAQEMSQKAKDDAETVLLLTEEIKILQSNQEKKLSKLTSSLNSTKESLRKAESDLALITQENIELEELIEAQDVQMENIKEVQKELSKNITVFNASKILTKIKNLL